MKWPSIQSESGVSLVSMLVAVGIMGIVAMGMMSLMDNVTMSQSAMEFKSQADNIHNEIRAHLSQVPACVATLSSANMTPGVKTPVGAIKNGDGTNRWALNTPYGDRTTQIGGMEFQYVNDTAPSTTSGTGVLTIHFDSVKRVMGSSRLAPRTVAIQVTKTPAGALLSCVALARMSDGLWQRSMADTNKIFYSAGNVGIGINNPVSKLDVAGEVRIASAGASCAPSNEGAIRYDASSKAFQGCDGVVWKNFGGMGNNCRWVNSNTDCTDYTAPHQASCDPGEYVNSVRTTQICFIWNNTYTTVSDLYCCK